MPPSAYYPRIFKIGRQQVIPMVREITWCDYSEIYNGHQNRLHLHHFHQLDVILDGEFTLTLEDGRAIVGQPGDAWVIPPLVQHGVDCKKHFRWSSCKFQLSPKFWPFFGTQFRRFHVPEYMREMMDEMGRRNSISTSFSGEHAAAAISLCLLEFIHQYPQQETTNSRLNNFQSILWPLLEKIQSSPDIRWTVKRMAAEIGLSPDHFSRRFQQIIKQTPQQYVLQTVMQSAAEGLIASPPISIKKIARKAGYANVQAFTHAFTRVFKVSPAAYRRQVLEDIENIFNGSELAGA